MSNFVIRTEELEDSQLKDLYFLLLEVHHWYKQGIIFSLNYGC